MYFSDSITLRATAVTLDTYGQPTNAYTDTTVFANRKSATRSEFYQANASGIKVEEVFEVHPEDYNDQHYVTYNSAQYDVVRAYRKGGVVELYCANREVLYTVTFTVKVSGVALAGATLAYNGESKTTDANGQAVFYSVPIGAQVYTASKTGHTTATGTVTVTADTAVNVAMVVST